MKSEDAVNARLSFITHTHTRHSCSDLLHLLVLAHASVSHEEVRVILLAQRNLLHSGFVQLGDQLGCK